MILGVLILLLSIPVGFILAHYARDELVSGRKWFLILIVLSLVVGIGYYNTPEIVFTCIFIMIATAICYAKSHDNEWVRNR